MELSRGKGEGERVTENGSPTSLRGKLDLPPREALKCKETGEEKTIVFGLTGTGYFDMVAYEKFHEGKMDDYIPTDDELAAYRARLPKIG